MKRFYSKAKAAPVEGGWRVELDDRPVRTPGRCELVLPSVELAYMVTREWREQGDEIDPQAMPATGFANAALDWVVPDRDAFAATISAYGESDMLCYRADPGSPLDLRQAELWDPILDWAERRYDIRFVRAHGVVHVPQSEDTLVRLRAVVAAENSFVLAGMQCLTSLAGSLIVALAGLEGARSWQELWRAACLEEEWQEQLWGSDAEALAARQARAAQFDAAARFCMVAREAGS